MRVTKVNLSQHRISVVHVLPSDALLNTVHQKQFTQTATQCRLQSIKLPTQTRFVTLGDKIPPLPHTPLPHPTPVVCMTIMQVTYYWQYMSTLLYLFCLFVISSTSTHLVWLPRYQICGKYKTQRTNENFNLHSDLDHNDPIFTQHTPEYYDAPTS